MFGFLKDPPPEFVFEIASDGIAMSRTRPPAAPQYAALPAGVLVPSPFKDNVLDHDAFAHAVARLVPAATRRAQRTAALILPDNAMRLAVLDFESFPAKEEERLALVKFRLRKTLPFDVDEAALRCDPRRQVPGRVVRLELGQLGGRGPAVQDLYRPA